MLNIVYKLHFLRPCEALRQVKKQQIKVKFWIWGPKTVY